MIIVDFVIAATEFPEEFFHVDGQLELFFDYLDQGLLRHGSFLVLLASKSHEAVQVLIGLIILLVLQF